MGLGSSKSGTSGSGWCGSEPQTRSTAGTGHGGNGLGFRAISDQFKTLDQVQDALRREGLESSNLILAIDCTKSNEWTGKVSNAGRSLHHLSADGTMNPYQLAVHVIGRTLSAFDDDQLIPMYGFGDATTGDRRVFSFKDGDQPCHGVEEAEAVYREVMPHVKLAGPTSFAPAIHQAIKIVTDSGNQMHILVLIADGQVTRPSDMGPDQLSLQERATIDAIVEASNYPLSIVMVGVGDGPWDTMDDFDDNIPTRRWDNFQFVNFTRIFQQLSHDAARLEATFALNALMEVPEQYKIIQRLGLMGASTPLRVRVPPPAPCPYPGLASHASLSSTQYPRIDSSRAISAADVLPTSLSGRKSPHTSNNLSGTYTDLLTGGAYDRMSPSFQDRPSGAAGKAAAAGVASGAPAPDGLFLCPITQELMHDPVLAADGYSYERSAIEQWLRTHNTSPMTNQNIGHKNVIPNHALRSSIMEYRTAHGLL